MWSVCLLVVGCGVLVSGGAKSPSNADKKRGLYDESYPGAQGMLIRTHFAAEGYAKPEDRGLGYALVGTYPVEQVPVAKYPVAQVPIAKYPVAQVSLAKYPQRYIVLHKMAVPAALPSAPIPAAVPYGLAYQQEAQVYPQQAQLYPTLPYQVKMQYAPGRYPYTYAPQVRYYVPKRVPLVTEDTLDFQRPPIDERSTYQLSPALQKPGLSVEEPTIYMPKQFYFQSTKEVYSEPKPIAYAIQVPDQQISVQKPIYLPVIDKNIQ